MGVFKKNVLNLATWGYGDSGYHDYSGSITLGNTTTTNTGTLVIPPMGVMVKERESNLAWLDRRVREMRVPL